MQEQKKQAEARFQALPMPEAKDENFRFTNLENFVFPNSESKNEPHGKLPQEFQVCDEGEEILLTVQNENAKKVFAKAAKKQDIYFTDLLTAAEEKPELLQKYLPLAKDFEKDKFAQLTAARWQNGAFLFISKNTSVELPLRAALWKGKDNFYYRNIIVLEEGAQAKFIEELSGDDTDSLVAGSTEIFLGENAQLSYAQVQRLGRETKFFQRQYVHVGKNSHALLTPIYLGGKKGQVRQDIHYEAEGGNVEIKGAARGDHEQHFDFWMNANHEVPNTSSALDFWFVMADKARAIFNGMIRITHEGANTSAYQKCRSLMLSPKATVHAIPKLEIATDAVKCSHGASVSMINPEQVHYLQSRGIPREEAEQMIIRGFTEFVMERLPTEALYERVDALLSAKQAEFYH